MVVSGSKDINVDTITMPSVDTLCQSVQAFTLEVTPFGGEWTGDGITDADRGIFDPEEATVGSNILYYTINGCMDSLEIFIKAIDASYNFSACPTETPFVVPGNWLPAGGVWTGGGIIDTLSGLYDPAILPNGSRDTLTYTVDGCAAERVVFIRQTEIRVDDILEFCTDDEVFALDRDNTGRRPGNGVWTGPGISNPQDNDWELDPGLIKPRTLHCVL